MLDQVLIVEGDQDIAGLIKVHLTELGLDTEHVSSAELALEKINKKQYHLVLSDIMLPNMDGLTLCRKLKDQQPHISVMMITAKSSEMDRVIGLEMGADDYITKPFSYREFQARVKAQLRHIRLLRSLATATNLPQRLELGELIIDKLRHQVAYKSQPLDLTATEFELLNYFVAHPDQVFSRVQLLDSVWGYQHSGYEHTVNSHINRLRSKLERHCGANIIETVWGVGYKLNTDSLVSHTSH